MVTLGYNFWIVSIGCFLLGAGAAAIGTYAYLRKKSLIGDTIAHAVLPGICIGFLISGTKNPFWLISGAFLSGWISTFLVEYIHKNSKIKQDTAIAGVLSVFFGIGILLLTYIQQTQAANKSGLDSYLFGHAASINQDEMFIFLALSLLILLFITLAYPYLKTLSFDSNFMDAVGMPRRFMLFLLTSATVLAVVAGIQAVGVVLMAALLLAPAASAHFWTNRLSRLLLIASLIGGFSGLSGAIISYSAPKMPTGPWIVIVLATCSLCSIIFAPKKGFIARKIRSRKISGQFELENLLKLFYLINERSGEEKLSPEYLENKLSKPYSSLKKQLKKLKSSDMLVQNDSGSWMLTGTGATKAARIVKLHRLWELYLTEHLNIAADHVHEDAETIEHIITPELEKRLEEKLNYPTQDPHQSPIPYGK